MIDYSTLIAIFREIAQRHSGENQMQSFAVVKNLSNELNAENFGKTVIEGKYGSYWTRKGITQNDDCKEYPALLLMRRSTDISDTFQVDDIALGVAIQYQSECHTYEEREILANELISDIVSYFRGYYSAKDANGNIKWFAPDFTPYLGYSITGNSIDYLLQNRGSLQIGTNHVGVDSLIVKSVSLRIQMCRKSQSTWSDYFDPNTYGTSTICDGCL